MRKRKRDSGTARVAALFLMPSALFTRVYGRRRIEKESRRGQQETAEETSCWRLRRRKKEQQRQDDEGEKGEMGGEVSDKGTGREGVEYSYFVDKDKAEKEK